MQPVRHRFDMRDLAIAVGPTGVQRTVLVQVLPKTSETLDFLALAGAPPDQQSGQQPEIAGVVGWVDLQAPDVGERIATLQQAPGGDRLVGIRHLVQDEADPDWLARADVLRGLRAVADAGLVYDLLVRPPQLAAAITAVRAVGEGRFVLDHLGKPAVRSGQITSWAADLTSLARAGQTAVKLSGLVTEADPGRPWEEQLKPYLATALAAFGPDRMMIGSDWPVCLLAASYTEVLDLAAKLTDGLDRRDQQAVAGGTAASWYRLPGLG